MPVLSPQQRLHIGMRAASSPMVRQDKIWARHSNDKVDVGHGLAHAIRAVLRSADPDRPLRALSLGSSSEPQFRVLEPVFRGGLWLVDVEQAAIDIITERNARQGIAHVYPVRGDYLELLGTDAAARVFVHAHLGGRRVDLVTLHHSLYYAPRAAWRPLLAALYSCALSNTEPAQGGVQGAIHAVLMASHSDDPTSAIWLYNHFAARFFGHRNNQDLPDFARELRNHPYFADAVMQTRWSRIRFWSDDFEELMHGVWMVLLHPNVHRFSEEQQREVIEHVYHHIYLPGVPLTQTQDHLFIYKPARVARPAALRSRLPAPPAGVPRENGSPLNGHGTLGG